MLCRVAGCLNTTLILSYKITNASMTFQALVLAIVVKDVRVLIADQAVATSAQLRLSCLADGTALRVLFDVIGFIFFTV